MSKLIIPEGMTVKPVEPAMPPVGTLTLIDAHGISTYDPQEDITAYETALIMRLLFRLTLGGPNGATPDWRTFLEEHKLTRHFKWVATSTAR